MSEKDEIERQQRSAISAMELSARAHGHYAQMAELQTQGLYTPPKSIVFWSSKPLFDPKEMARISSSDTRDCAEVATRFGAVNVQSIKAAAIDAGRATAMELYGPKTARE
jgi:hypothetical protein